MEQLAEKFSHQVKHRDVSLLRIMHVARQQVETRQRPQQIDASEGERQYADQLNETFPRARKDSVRK